MRSHGEDPVRREYARIAGGYDRRWSFYIASTVRETIRRLDPLSIRRVLDVGCGTGALLQALSLSSPDATLAGVDPSPEMLRVARGKLSSAVELKRARAEELPFRGGSFDLAISTSALHFMRHPRQALQEMIRVLRPGGSIVITDWCDDYLACRLCDLILRAFNRAHVRVYGREECRRFLEEAELESVTVDRYRINWLWGLMTGQAKKRAV